MTDGRVTELRGSGEGSTVRHCSFCHGAGEKVVDVEIDGFITEVVIDCPHP